MKFRALVTASLLGFGAFGLLACANTKSNKVTQTAVVVPQTLRVAVFNIRELSTENLTLTDANGIGQNPQTLAAAQIIQRINPDVLLICEIDHDYSIFDGSNASLAENLRRFHNAYITQGENPVHYSYFYAAPSNTGILSPFDFDNNGRVATKADEMTRDHGGDAWGYGEYPGQYSMGILSRFPIDEANVRTFQNFLWKDLPGNHLPTEWYSPEEQAAFRLSSKSHWNVPVLIPTASGNSTSLHLFASHPTPPVFDGPEDRNGRRNFDEVRFWAEYLNNNEALYDDNKRFGGFNSNAPFVILGDLNASVKSDPIYTGELAIETLFNHPRVIDYSAFTISNGGLMSRPAGAPEYWERATADFGNGARVDYVLASQNLNVVGGGVFWPSVEEDAEGNKLALRASDHRLVWLDVELTVNK